MRGFGAGRGDKASFPQDRKNVADLCTFTCLSAACWPFLRPSLWLHIVMVF